jgi:ribonucleotide reductase alpha subunit
MTMVRDLMSKGLWNSSVAQYTMNNGVLPDSIPADIRAVYDVVWNMKQRYLQDRAALRSMYIDQAQSLNLYVKDVSAATQATLLINGWKLGLMTCSYYIHSRSATMARKNNIEEKNTNEAASDDVCRPGCDSCSS